MENDLYIARIKDQVASMDPEVEIHENEFYLSLWSDRDSEVALYSVDLEETPRRRAYETILDFATAWYLDR